MTDEKKITRVSALEQYPEHVKAIGMISIEIANLELFLGRMLAALIHTGPQLGEIIYLTPRTTIGRIEILENVAHCVLTDNSEGKKHLQKIITRTKAVMQKRHRMIHVVWAVKSGEPSEVIQLPVPNKDEAAQGTIVPLKKLTDFVRDIRFLADEVRAHTIKINNDWITQLQKEVE